MIAAARPKLSAQPRRRVTLPASGWQPRGYQLPLWEYLEGGGLRAMEVAHRRWGKDDVFLHWSAISAHQKIGNYWHLLPEYEQGRKAIWNAVNPKTGKRRIDEAFPKELRASTNAGDMFIRFKNGSTWQVIGSDNYHSLVGTVPIGVCFSEWAKANPAAWAYLAPILAENGGWAAFITTPQGNNHAKKMLDVARANRRTWFSEVSTVKDTKAIDTSLIEADRELYHAMYGEDAGDALIEQEYYCSFAAAVLGSYYGKAVAKLELAGRIREVPYDLALPVHAVWDLGKGANMAIWLFQVAPDGVRIIAFIQGSHDEVIPDLVGKLDEFAAERAAESGVRFRWGTDWVPHDARVKELGTGKTRVETLIGLGRRPEIVPDHKVDDGIAAARLLLPRCWFDAVLCELGLDALRQYKSEWDDDLKVFKDKPLHDWTSHAADAFRYLAMCVRLIKVELGTPADPHEALREAMKSARGIENMTVDELLQLQHAGSRRMRV